MAETAKNDQNAQGAKATTAARSAGRTAASTASRASKKTESAAADVREAGTGHVVALTSKAKAGGEFLSTVPAKSLQAATTAWAVVKHRRAIVAGAGGGAIAALVGAYGLGRVSARRGHGPITRATGGRF
ncbi:hypothetical protein ABZ916_24110 [Streptomyces sp. NPDC046853]|uniref:hypothetical protein n=1 Tax=Streptomyces sp. NPDC046853 TaxID=3154920 RepID=UPI0033C8D5AA